MCVVCVVFFAIFSEKINNPPKVEGLFIDEVKSDTTHYNTTHLGEVELLLESLEVLSYGL